MTNMKNNKSTKSNNGQLSLAMSRINKLGVGKSVTLDWFGTVKCYAGKTAKSPRKFSISKSTTWQAVPGGNLTVKHIRKMIENTLTK